MTRDDIIRMAREAGVPDSWDLNWFDPYYERFANLIAAAEREACAKVAEERLIDKANCTAEQMYEMLKTSIAEDIRARG